MRAGSVASIRVNPRDSMSVVDIVKSTGMYVEGMSFPQMVSLALSGCLQALRDNGVIPDRQGFEYQEVMKGILNSGHGGKKLIIANRIHKQGSEFKVDGFKLRPTESHEAAPISSAPEDVPPEVRRARVLFGELNAKKELHEENPEVTWDIQDQREWQRLYAIVYPDG